MDNRTWNINKTVCKPSVTLNWPWCVPEFVLEVVDEFLLYLADHFTLILAKTEVMDRPVHLVHEKQEMCIPWFIRNKRRRTRWNMVGIPVRQLAQIDSGLHSTGVLP